MQETRTFKEINAAGKRIESDKEQIMLVILYPLSFSK